MKLSGRDLWVFRKTMFERAVALGYDETVGMFGHSRKDMFYWRELAVKEGRTEDMVEWDDLLRRTCAEMNG